jgi:uncharacterized protein
LLNIRTVEELRRSPAVGAVWETFVFAQLRHRERLAGRSASLFFWRDRAREVDFLVDIGGRLEAYEARWSELPDAADCANLVYLRRSLGKRGVVQGGVVCRAGNDYPLADGWRAITVGAL